MTEQITGRAKGGAARATALSPERRREIAMQGVAARKERLTLPRATHGSSDNPLRIGDIEIPCYVLEDETRVLSQRGLIGGLGMARGSARGGGDQLTAFVDGLLEKSIITNELSVAVKSPILFMPPHGGRPAFGYPATVLADLCEAILAARTAGKLSKRQENLANQCEILVRGFARVGIIALVDEATGYERDRVAGSLAKILEAFIAKELQPWVRTFPADYYEQLYRLRGLPYASNSVRRPQYFGVLTNDIVYKRLAPGVLEELKNVSQKDDDGRLKHKLFQKLTANVGYPKLREHLGSVVTLMKLSKGYQDFKNKLDQIHPIYGRTIPLSLEYKPDEDSGKGL